MGRGMWRIRFSSVLRAARPLAGPLAVALVMMGAVPPGARAGDTASAPSDGCPQFGAGFKRLPGSDTCVQMGGAVQMSAGRGNTVSNAPNQGPQITPSAVTPPPATPQSAPDPWKQAR